jgi:uroporphyrinogen-III decarboxylase
MMTSRERLLKVLNGEIPDRVPVSTYELCGFNSKAFENNDKSYERLMQKIRQDTDCVCMWEPASNAKFLESAFPVEIEMKQWRENDSQITHKIVHTPKGDIANTTRVMDNVHTVWQTEHWCKNIEDVEKALSVPYTHLDYDVLDYARIKSEMENRGIIMASLSDTLCVCADLMNFGDYTIWAMTETDHFVKTLEVVHSRIMENLKRMLDVNIVDLYRICGPEYASPPYMPPQLFDKFVVPFVTEMIELIHSRGAKVRLHCHGKIGKILDSICKTGCDAIDPCEASPDGDISLSEVKKRVGDKVCIFGNVQLKLLETASMVEIENTVRDCMNAAKKGGRYVIMPTAAPINSPLSSQTEKNYNIFIDTALELGKY